MSLKSEKLKKMLFKATNIEWYVWYENRRGGGWMFSNDRYAKQRLGYNYLSSEKFIKEFDWSILNRGSTCHAQDNDAAKTS